jgi:hypothetical protein
MMDDSLTVNCSLPSIPTRQRGRIRSHLSEPLFPAETGKLPRVAKLMALAIHFDQLIRDGKVRDQADLARLGRVTRARMSQIMNLLNLAPDIQEALLFLSRVQPGSRPPILADLQPIAREWNWTVQRKSWQMLIRSR